MELVFNLNNLMEILHNAEIFLKFNSGTKKKAEHLGWFFLHVYLLVSIFDERLCW